MKTKPPLHLLILFHRLAGVCDSLTGLLLVIAPLWTLRRMGIGPALPPPEMVSFIGAFVLGVGLAYLVTSRRPKSPDDLIPMVTVWLVTGLSRTLVAGVLIWKIGSGQMEPAWITVAVTDGLLASAQFFGIRQRWLAPDQWRVAPGL